MTGRRKRAPERKEQEEGAPLQVALDPVLTRVAGVAGRPLDPAGEKEKPPRRGRKAASAGPAKPKAGGGRTAFDDLADRFGLSAFERTVLVLAALPALEPASAELIAMAQGDERLKIPTVAFAFSVLEGGHWSAFAADGRLRAPGLIELGEDVVSSARQLILPERVLHHLVGLNALDEMLAVYGEEYDKQVVLAPSQTALAEGLANRLEAAAANRDAPLLLIVGDDRKAAFAVAAAAVQAAGCRPLGIDVETLPSAPAERSRVARLLGREYGLARRVPVFDAHELTASNDRRAFGRFLVGLACPAVVLSAETLEAGHRAVEIALLPRGTSMEQEELWRAELGSLARPMAKSVERLAAHFTVSPDLIGTIAASATRQAAQDRKARRPAAEMRQALADFLWFETRKLSRPHLDDLAERIEPAVGWDDIILPVRKRDMLKTIAAQVRSRAIVHEKWGFGGGGGRGLGISALFCGPSGTGKTLAAEVIGTATGLEVYRVDLSGVVSKWIGETERNLKRVFDAAEASSSIIVFEEADALFGKRTEVRESHDRYANIEVSYLLQRMESYRGLAILTTNMRSHLDQAFLRRLRFVVDFPFPGEVERRGIWELAFPKNAPCEGLDPARLAQLNVPGGNIKNIALNAAFLAAEEGTPIRMNHVQAAARAEYEKIGKVLTDAELRGWSLEVVHG
ncbi:ATP-binding protein [Rhizobium terrae]|uniref:ATP-binding protein n=1 Tax=Rhizobium terrae TaxID=2171756 RepID=UPI000E3EBF12|nr:ATP-binding protein [Rhizobium terrae]